MNDPDPSSPEPVAGPPYRLPGTLLDLVIRPRRALATIVEAAPVAPAAILSGGLALVLAMTLLGSRLVPRPGGVVDGVLGTALTPAQAVVTGIALVLVPLYLALLAALAAAIARRLGGRKGQFRPVYAVVGHAALVLAPMAVVFPIGALLGGEAGGWLTLVALVLLLAWAAVLAVLGIARAVGVDWVLALSALVGAQVMVTSLLCCCVVVLSGLAGG